MTKKITLVMLVLLIVSAFVFVSCEQEELGARTGKSTAEPDDNLVYNGYFDKGFDSDLKGDGASADIEAGVGIGGSNGMLVEQTTNYGEVVAVITDYYGAGKSYYVQASFKNNGSTNDEDLTARLSFSVVTGGAYAKVGRDYDVPGQYEGGWLDDGDAETEFGKKTNCEGEDIEDGGWHTVSAVLTGEEIAAIMAAEDEQNGVAEEDRGTMYKLMVVFFVGTYSESGLGQEGYNYVLDNVYIQDLNPELPRQGATYEAPEVPDPEEEEEEEEEGE